MDRLDDAILRAFAEWRTPWLNRAAADVSSLGSMLQRVNKLDEPKKMRNVWMKTICVQSVEN